MKTEIHNPCTITQVSMEVSIMITSLLKMVLVQTNCITWACWVWLSWDYGTPTHCMSHSAYNTSKSSEEMENKSCTTYGLVCMWPVGMNVSFLFPFSHLATLQILHIFLTNCVQVSSVLQPCWTVEFRCKAAWVRKGPWPDSSGDRTRAKFVYHKRDREFTLIPNCQCGFYRTVILCLI